MSEINSQTIVRDVNAELLVESDQTLRAQHKPDAISPIESKLSLTPNANLISLTKSAAMWAARVNPQTARKPSKDPSVTFSIDTDMATKLYTPDTLSSIPRTTYGNGMRVTDEKTWKALVVSPNTMRTDYAGDVAPFSVGIRGVKAHLPSDTFTARNLVVNALRQPNSRSTDFTEYIVQDSAVINIWRFGPGAFAVDVIIPEFTPKFNSILNINIKADESTLREAYIPKGGFYRPGGSVVKLNKISDTEINVILDLRRADPRNAFIRVIVVWELTLDGQRLQCLAALRARNPQPAPQVGAILAGGATVGNRPYPIGSGLSYSFAKVNIPSAGCAISPEGYPVIVPVSGDNRTSLFGENNSLTIDVKDVEIKPNEYLLTITGIIVGGWNGESDPKSKLVVEMSVDNTWIPISTYSFSNKTEYPQSFPATYGSGINRAGTQSGAYNKYQFSNKTKSDVRLEFVPSVTATPLPATVSNQGSAGRAPIIPLPVRPVVRPVNRNFVATTTLRSSQQDTPKKAIDTFPVKPPQWHNWLHRPDIADRKIVIPVKDGYT